MNTSEIIATFIGLQLTEIEPSFPSFLFEGKLRFQIDCPWRIRHGNYIVAGNLDYRSKIQHETLLAEMQEYLIGQRITAIELDEDTCDLRLKLGELTLVQLFPTSANYEAWNLRSDQYQISGGLNGEVMTSF